MIKTVGFSRVLIPATQPNSLPQAKTTSLIDLSNGSFYPTNGTNSELKFKTPNVITQNGETYSFDGINKAFCG